MFPSPISLKKWICLPNYPWLWGFSPEVWGLGKWFGGKNRFSVLAFLRLQCLVLHPLSREFLHSPTQTPPPPRSLPMYCQAKLIVSTSHDNCFDILALIHFSFALTFQFFPLACLILVSILRTQPRARPISNNQYTPTCVALKIIYFHGLESSEVKHTEINFIQDQGGSAWC